MPLRLLDAAGRLVGGTHQREDRSRPVLPGGGLVPAAARRGVAGGGCQTPPAHGRGPRLFHCLESAYPRQFPLPRSFRVAFASLAQSSVGNSNGPLIGLPLRVEGSVTTPRRPGPVAAAPACRTRPGRARRT